MYQNIAQRKILSALCSLFQDEDCALSPDTISKLIYKCRRSPRFSALLIDTIKKLNYELEV